MVDEELGIAHDEFENRAITLPDNPSKNGSRVVPAGCAICLCSYQVGDFVTWSEMVECKHAFHLDCITSWFAKKEEEMKCPCCRSDFISLQTLHDNITTTTSNGHDTLDLTTFQTTGDTEVLQQDHATTANNTQELPSLEREGIADTTPTSDDRSEIGAIESSTIDTTTSNNTSQNLSEVPCEEGWTHQRSTNDIESGKKELSTNGTTQDLPAVLSCPTSGSSNTIHDDGESERDVTEQPIATTQDLPRQRDEAVTTNNNEANK